MTKGNIKGEQASGGIRIRILYARSDDAFLLPARKKNVLSHYTFLAAALARDNAYGIRTCEKIAVAAREVIQLPALIDLVATKLQGKEDGIASACLLQHDGKKVGAPRSHHCVRQMRERTA